MIKEGKACNGVKIVSSINSLDKTGLVHAKIMKLDDQIIPHTRVNLKLIKDLNVSHNTIQILEKNVSVKFQISCIAIFLPIYLLGQGK